MDCDEQDEGTVGPQFQDDNTKTPTWLREEVGLGLYQQAAREGKVFAQSVCSQKNLTFIVDQSPFSQSCSSAQKDCINTAEPNTNPYIFVMNSYHRPSNPFEPSLAKEF